MNAVLLYAGGGMTALWGIAHLFPTRSVVEGFGDLSADNRRIVTMEWIVEGVALIFIGLLVVTVTYMGPGSDVSRAVCVLSSLVLICLAVVSLFTGFKVNFIPFKLCPVIFSLSAILILWGAFI